MTTKTKPRLLFADTETSGLADSVDEAIALDRQVIEYAFVIWEDGDRVKQFQKKVMPTGDAVKDAEHCAANGWNHFDATQWNNWRKVGSREYEPVPAVPWGASDCEKVDEFFTGETLAGSNPGFDLIMFKAAFHGFGVGHMFPKLGTHRMCDVGQLAWPLWSAGLTEKTGLEALTKLLGVKHEAHTAMGDVDAEIACFEILIETYLYRPRQLTDLLRELGNECKVSGVVDAEIAKLRGLGL